MNLAIKIMWKNKRVLVAGGRGFIGSNLVQRLIKIGAIVTLTERINQNICCIKREENKTIISVDLTKREDCELATKDQDIVFMCAAVTHGAAFMKENPLALVTPNILMNMQMLDASYKNNVKKFVFISSSAAYPDTKDRPVKEEELFNDDPAECYFPVAWMKRYSEILCKTYATKIKKQMHVVVVRPSNLFGPFDDYDFETSHVTASLIRKVAEHHDPIEIWGTGDDVRDILYIEDFLDGLLLATEKLNKYEPVNIAYGKAFSIREILWFLLKIEGYEPKIMFNNAKPSMIPIRLIDTSKAKALLNFEPKRNVFDRLAMTLQWYKDTYLR